MRLLEYQGKQLLARHGIAVPRGRLWPDLPEGAQGFVVKAQVAEGGRGKRGGIRFVGSSAEAIAVAERLLDAGFDGTNAERIYIEERLTIERELYLAVALDRDRRCRVILASPDGGVDIESVSPGHVLRLPINPLAGIGAPELAATVAFLGLPDAAADAARQVVGALHDLAVAEDAELAEINPLVLTSAGALVAADAKVVLDPNAGFRHPEWRDLVFPSIGAVAERRIAAAGAVGVEIDPAGTIIGVVSGAGLMMATLDLLVAGGGRPRLMIDLGGVVLGPSEGMVPLFETLGSLVPKATFINVYFQTALCDDFARALAAAYTKAPFPGRVVMRLKGRNEGEARAILKPFGFQVHGDLRSALEATLAVAGTPG